MRTSKEYRDEEEAGLDGEEAEELDVLVLHRSERERDEEDETEESDDEGTSQGSSSTSSTSPTRRKNRYDYYSSFISSGSRSSSRSKRLQSKWKRPGLLDEVDWWNPSRVATSWGKRLHRHTGLFRLTILSSILLGAALAIFAGYWVIWFLLLRHEAFAHSVFSEPMIPEPKDLEIRARVFPPFEPGDAKADELARTEHVTNELMQRYIGLGMQTNTLQCTWTPALQEKYADLPHHGPYLFALNLFNSKDVLPCLSSTLLRLATFLGTNNTHISIFENGSWDNTPDALANLAAALTSLGVGHTITSDERETKWDQVDRIAQLAVYRNVALQAVNTTIGNSSIPSKPDEVIFINDVFVCPKDALELIWQRRYQQADASCALDWRPTSSKFEWLGFHSVKFYDNWVTRSITGDMLRNRIDILGEYRDGINELFDQPGQDSSRKRFRSGVPTPVYSCWNGIIALPAKPFQGDEKRPATLFRSVFNVQGECAASECKTLAKDFWAQGLKRWMIVPSVHVTYTQNIYNHHSLVNLAERAEAKHSKDIEKIDWGSLDDPKSVVCYPWARGFHIDLPYRRTRESPIKKRR